MQPKGNVNDVACALSNRKVTGTSKRRRISRRCALSANSVETQHARSIPSSSASVVIKSNDQLTLHCPHEVKLVENIEIYSKLGCAYSHL